MHLLLLLLLLERWHWAGMALARHHQRCGEATAALSRARSIPLHWEGGLGASIFPSSSLSSSSSAWSKQGLGEGLCTTAVIYSQRIAQQPLRIPRSAPIRGGKLGFGNGKPEKVGMRMLSPRKALGEVTSTSMVRQNRSRGSAALPGKLPWINVHNEGCGCHHSPPGSRKNSTANHFG